MQVSEKEENLGNGIKFPSNGRSEALEIYFIERRSYS